MSETKRGMAIPIVLVFILVVVTFLMTTSSFRSRVKKQNLASHTQKKAYYMAMGGIQHAMLKLRILQRQAYDAASLARGVCPFFNMVGSKIMTKTAEADLPNKTPKALNIFLSDLNTASVPISIGEDIFGTTLPAERQWRYEVTKFSVLSYYTATDTANYGAIRIVLNVESMGYAQDSRDSTQSHKEFINKKIILERRMTGP